MSGHNSNVEIRIQEHKHIIDSQSLNHLTERIAREGDFLHTTLSLLDGLQFPAYRQQIIDHVTAISSDSECIRLYETLDHYIRYDCIEQMQAAFEVNLPFSKHSAIAGRRDEIKVVKTTPTT